MNPVSAAFTSALILVVLGRSNRYNLGTCCTRFCLYISTCLVKTKCMYRFERVKDQHARGARGAGARRSLLVWCVRSEVTALHVYRRVVLVDSFPSAVLTTLRIAEGMYGTREGHKPGPRFERTLGPRASVSLLNQTEDFRFGGRFGRRLADVAVVTNAGRKIHLALDRPSPLHSHPARHPNLKGASGWENSRRRRGPALQPTV